MRKVENELVDVIVQDGIHTEIKKKEAGKKNAQLEKSQAYVVLRYWIKNLSNLHNRIALELDRCLLEKKLP